MNAIPSKLAAILALALAGGIAVAQPAHSPQQAAPGYSQDEHARMTHCIGVADNVQSIAEYKLAGQTALNVKRMFAALPTGAQLFPTIDKVFGDTFVHPWDYAVSYFKSCAAEIAQVPAERLAPAIACMQNGMVASAAKKLKDAGTSKENAYPELAKYGKDAQQVVDTVYAQAMTRMEGQMETWNACMTPLSPSAAKP